jgi:hypothetical protein
LEVVAQLERLATTLYFLPLLQMAGAQAGHTKQMAATAARVVAVAANLEPQGPQGQGEPQQAAREVTAEQHRSRPFMAHRAAVVRVLPELLAFLTMDQAAVTEPQIP